jgi:hypothetical protein
MKNLDLAEAKKNIVVSESGAISFVGKEATAVFTLLAIKGAMKLETRGMKMSRGANAVKSAQSWFDHLKINVKLPRTKVKAYEVYCEVLTELGIIK